MMVVESTITAEKSEKNEAQAQPQDEKERQKRETIRQINERNKMRLINAKKFAAFIR